MALSTKAVNEIAEALTPEVIDYISGDSRWVDFMHEIVPDAIKDEFGDIDEDLLFDLSLCVMDKIRLTKSS